MLETVAGKIPASSALYRPGVVISVGSWLGVSVDGNPVTARYADPLVLAVGDPVLVLISSNGPYGQAEAFVLCRLTASPRPSTGTVTVVPASSATISVRGADGVTYKATFAYTSPAVNDVVILSWNAAVPTALAKVTTTAGAAAPYAPVAAQASSTSGTSTYPATDSASWTPTFGAWDAWAGGGGNLYQGGASYGGPSNGAWFYNGAAGELSGRTIARIQFRIGARRNIGSYNSPVAFHFYAHSSANRPAGDVARTSGPYDVTVQPGQGAATIDLPLSFAATLQSGGGIGISGESYAGMAGRYTQPDSGTLQIDWSR